MPGLAVLSCYFDFNDNPWLERNARHCATQWRAAGAHVVFVEIALHGTPFVFHKAVDEGANDDRNLFHTLVQCHVKDVMWYKDAALNIALRHVPTDCTHVGWFDNDVYFARPPDDVAATAPSSVEPSWWVDAIRLRFQQDKSLVLLQPFSEVALTTETTRNALLGRDDEPSDDAPPPPPPSAASDDEDDAGDETKGALVTETAGTPAPTEPTATATATPTATATATATARLSDEDTVDRCRQMRRMRKCIMRDSKLGVSGSAWVAPKSLLVKTGFFAHACAGGGEDFVLNLLQGAMSSHRLPVTGNALQQYYFQDKGTFASSIMRYRRKWTSHPHVRLPVRCAYLPHTLIHLFHGELETKTTHIERHLLFRHRKYNAPRHVCANLEHDGLLQWTEAFRQTGICSALKASFERRQSVRDKVLLRIAKTQNSLLEIRQQVATLMMRPPPTPPQQQQQQHRPHRSHSARTALSASLCECLRAFDEIPVQVAAVKAT